MTSGETGNHDRDRRVALGELVAAGLTGAVHLFFEEVLHAKMVFIALAAAGWIGYVALRLRRAPGTLALWGFRRAGLGPAAALSTAVFAAGAGGIVAVALLRGTLTANWHILPLFLVYPLWGYVQHFLLQAMVARNLQCFWGSSWAVTPVVAVFFGAVHWPDLVLAGATFLLALVFTPIYLRWRNLWPLGIYHGWLGAMAYFWLLRRDPWAEIFG
jgi:hypothetical protein